MTPRTIRAMKASINHWRDNCKAIMPDQASTAPEDCALCRRFGEFCEIERTGEKCPVFAATGEDQCVLTPYYDARDALKAAIGDDGPIAPFIEAAQAELDFLISLLPEGEKA